LDATIHVTEEDSMQKYDMEADVADSRARLAARQANIAALTLVSAGFMSLVRALILPWLIAHSPANTFKGMDAHSIQMMGLAGFALFFLLAMWASKDPLPAVLAALIFYIGVSIPDLMVEGGILQKGIISKVVMLGILGRGLGAGVMHRCFR
jgi:hypothetical protein